MSQASKFQPYQNESEVVELAGLTVENRVDRVSIFGSIDLTKDKPGLKAAEELLCILSKVVAELKAADLPEKITTAPVEEVPNPFL